MKAIWRIAVIAESDDTGRLGFVDIIPVSRMACDE